MNRANIYSSYLSFLWQHELLFFLSVHRIQSCTVYVYIYISTPSVYMDLLAGDQIRMSMFIRSTLLLVIFFSLCIQYTICQTSSCTIHKYIWIYTTTLFHHEKRGFWRTSNRLFDNLLFIYFFFSFFLSFLFWLIANWQKHTYWMWSFSEL